MTDEKKPKYNKDKIILMTQLAVYDKNLGEADKRVNDYYLHDYIIKNNFATIIAVIAGCFILFIFYVLNLVFNGGAELLALDYNALFRRFAFFTLVTCAFFAVISTILAIMRYHIVKKRIADYVKKLALLDNEKHWKKTKRKIPRKGR